MPFVLKHLFTCRLLSRSNSGLYFYNVIKLSYILNPSTPSQVNKLGSFKRKKSLELRTGDSQHVYLKMSILCSLCYMFICIICIIVTNCTFNDNKILNLNLNLLLLLMGEYILQIKRIHQVNCLLAFPKTMKTVNNISFYLSNHLYLFFPSFYYLDFK